MKDIFAFILICLAAATVVVPLLSTESCRIEGLEDNSHGVYPDKMFGVNCY